MSDIPAFLKELSALTLKHKLTIDGCGCCGSPWISHTDATVGQYVADAAKTADGSLLYEYLKFRAGE